MLKLGHRFNAIFIVNNFNPLQHLQSFRSSSSKVFKETQIQSHLLNYLINSLGFSKQQSLSNYDKISKTIALKNLTNSYTSFIAKSDSVIFFLKEYGFGSSDIRRIVRLHPVVLSASIDKTLKPKFKALEELGLFGKDVVELLVLNPSLLRFRLRPQIELLRKVLGKNEMVVKMLRRQFDLSLAPKYLVSNVSLLEDCGVSIDRIHKNLCLHPYVFMRKTELIRESIVRAEKELGISRSSKMFLIGIYLLLTFSAKDIKRKIGLFKSFGWTDDCVMELIRKNPYYLGFSDETMKKKLEFFMNEVGYKPDYILSHAFVLTCSLEGKVLPRYKLLLVLKEKDFVNMDFSLYYVLCLTEPKFVNRMVLPYKEVHDLYTKLTGNSLKIRPKSKVAA